MASAGNTSGKPAGTSTRRKAGRAGKRASAGPDQEVDWLAGTSGFSYKEWKGRFYPEDLKDADMLAYYASRLRTVEINNTFYRMPKSSVVQHWAEVVPDDFRFVIKASRRITHQLRLNGIDEPLEYLQKAVSHLGDKLGAVLFQLPPFLRKDTDRLQNLLRLWPRELPAALEFRHESWFDTEVMDNLEAHGLALCLSEDGKLAIPERIATADWLYLRLRQPGYSTRQLTAWARRARDSGADRAFVFFKHEDAGAGPELAEKFLRLAGRPEPRRAAERQPQSATGATAPDAGRAPPARAARKRAPRTTRAGRNDA